VKRTWSLCAGVAVLAVMAATTVPAHAVDGNLPGGTSISVTIGSPANGTIRPPGPVTVTGTASVGEGVPVADTALVYVLDVSGSTAVGGGCGGDPNGDGRNNEIMDCEIAAATTLNDEAVGLGTVADVGVAVFAEDADTGDVGTAGGVQLVTGPATDADGSGGRDVEQVLRSARSTPGGSLGLFTPRSVGGNTDFADGVRAATTAANASDEPRKLVIFLSDGVATVGDNVSGPLSAVPANVDFYTFAVGSGSSCGNTGGGRGSLQQIADATGGTCTPVPDVGSLPDILPGVIAARLLSLSLRVNGGAPTPITNVAPPLPVNGPASVNYSVTTGSLGAGTHELCVTANGSDNGGAGSVTDCVTVIVNAPPVVNPGGPFAGQEGTAVAIAGTVTDPDGPNATRTWSVTPGAGVDPGTTCSIANPAALSTTITCTDDGSYTLTLTANDGVNPPVSANTALTLTNVAPAVSISAPANGTVYPTGANVAFTAPFTDIGTNDSHTCTVNFDDGSPIAPGTVVEAPGSGTCTSAHVFTVAGPHNVLVRVTDDDGGSATAVVTIIINAPPQVDPGGPFAGQEGIAVGIAGSVVDPDSPGVTTLWSIVPAGGVDPGATCSIANPAALSTTVTCTDDGVYSLKLTADDGINAPVSAITTLTLTNVAPVVSISAPANGAMFVRGTTVAFTAPFTDIGTNDSHTCTVNFDDGTPIVPGTVNEVPGSGTCTTTHSFSALGPHNVLVRVTDDDGGAATAVVTVVIYLPAEAFAIQASGLVTIPKTPHATCPPDEILSQVGLSTPIASLNVLNASCTVNPTTGRTVAEASIDGASLLGGVIVISNIESSCVADASGIFRSSRVGTINGTPIGGGSGSIGIPGVAQVFYNETTTVGGKLAQNAIRVRTLLGQEIILAGCRLG